ncbi:MAG: ATP-binding cassette domain-containing protein [Chitinivibrionales bacterium]|nr:ATP-binding cassette domain-containing protein [Chitinivibrionales bacterium]MBD3397074.1 ATP-binding cassette domain-containing protein [Chitinivibrionales bacterium]
MIELQNVSKSFAGGVTAARDISFRVGKGETVVLIGLSGCGKTTTLKMINRLVESDRGTISIDGAHIDQWHPVMLRRNIGYVIQGVGLLPHYTVSQNVAIVPGLKGWRREDITNSVEKMLKLVGLEPAEYGDRYPHELSGGQKQRVGVARALAGNPDIVLMDEPFGALDPITREELQDEFLKLQQMLKKTIVFVTHDIFEAVKMGDRIGIMNNGVMEQLDRPAVILKQPVGDFVERFVGQHKEYLTEYANRNSARG